MNTPENQTPEPIRNDATNPDWLLNYYKNEVKTFIEHEMESRRINKALLEEEKKERKSKRRNDEIFYRSELVENSEKRIHALDSLDVVLPELAILDAQIIKLREKRRALVLSTGSFLNPFSI